MKQINIVTKVERTRVTNLTGMVRLTMSTVSLPASIEWESLEIKPHAQLVITDKQQNKNTVWTAKLSFKTCQQMPDRDRYAYLCHLSDGQRRLIGSDERPYPVMSVQENMPENVADNQLNEVSVSWDSPLFIPYVRN